MAHLSRSKSTEDKTSLAFQIKVNLGLDCKFNDFCYNDQMFLMFLRTGRAYCSVNGLLEQKNRKQTTQPTQICVQVVLFQTEDLRVSSP